MDQCSRFLAITPSERWKIVKEQQGCFSCLKHGKGHSSFNCSCRVLCGKKCSDGSACKRRHHGLLLEESSSTLNVAFIQDSSRAILPVISGFMKGKQGDVMETNVFCNSGTQVSLIRSARAEQLGLEHKPVTIVITKVGGVEEELDTKVYRVPLHADSRKLIKAIQTVGISQISEDSPKVNIDHISRVLEIPTDKLHRKEGPIHLLILINYPRFHVGETKVKDGLVARKSPLGWVIFGSDSDDAVPETKQVLHVRLAKPVNLTKFWKTESMGVSVSPCTCEAAEMSLPECTEMKMIEEPYQLQGKKWIMQYPTKRDPSCLPNNYAQVLKKLECTE